MRTTVTLDPDVAAKLKALAHRRRASFKETLNEVLRRGLAARPTGPGRQRFVVHAHRGGFRLGIGKLNQLLDELDVEYTDFARFSGLRWRDPLADAR